MKILYLSDYKKGTGGIATFVPQVVKALEERDHEVRFIDIAGSDSEIGFTTSKSNKIRAYKEKIFSPRKRNKIIRKIDDFDPDLIHVHNIHSAPLPVMRAIEEVNIPSIKNFNDFGFFCECDMSMHGFNPCSGNPIECWRHDEISTKQLIFRKPIHMMKLSKINVFDTCLAPSRSLESFANNFVKTERLPYFVDDQMFSRVDSGLKSEILFVGRLSEEKGFDILLEAIQNMDLEVGLEAVGSGDIENYQKMARNLGILDQVDFVGEVEHDKVPKYMAGAEVAIVPSRIREAFGIVGIEALSSGTPVIGADIGGIPDYIEDGKNGFLFEPGNSEDLAEKIELFYEEKDKIDFSGNAVKRSREFSKEKHIEKLLSIYTETLN